MAKASTGKARKAGLVWPTAAMLAALSVLIALGIWQLQRKAWKEGLIEAIAARATADPIPLDAAMRRWQGHEDLEYTRVRAVGHYLNDKAQFYYAPGKGGLGFHVYAPLRTPAGTVVIVNRGFIPDRLKDSITRADGAMRGDHEVVGLLRGPGHQGLFTPDNEPARDLWFWRDLQGMARSALGEDAQDVAPFFLDEVAHDKAAWPRGGATRLELPNRHLEYALTWFGLAGALIAVYFAFVLPRWRLARQERNDSASTCG